MKLTTKELKFTWLFFFFITSFFCILLKELNKVKGKGNVKIYGIIFMLLYLIYGIFLLYFLISTKKSTNIDKLILWGEFVLITSLTGISKTATQERLDTFHFLTFELAMLYILYLYYSYYKNTK